MKNPVKALTAWARGLIQREQYPDRSRRLFRLGKTPAGVYVDHDVALTLGAVNACVRAVAETLGVLEWHQFRRESSGKRSRVEGPLDTALSLMPNPEMTAQTLREVLAAQAMLRGNGYAEIVRDGGGRVVELWPLPPVRDIYRVNGELVYDFWIDGQSFPLRSRDVFHLKGLGSNGISGYDVVSYMAASIGYGIAVEEFSAEYFQNGAAFSAVLQHPKTLTKDAQDRLIADMEDNYAGRGKRHRFKVLEEGMTIKEMSATARQAQLIEAMKLSVEQIARWFRVPLHKIGSLDRATFNNIEHLGIEFIQDTILPWTVRFEQEANVKLLSPAERRTNFTKMKISTLARGDLKSRMEAYRIGREWGWLTPNMIAEMEDSDPIAPEMGGDTLIVPLNFQDARVLVKTTERALEDPEPVEPDPPEPEPAGLMRHTLSSACRRVMDREERYVGRKMSNGRDIGAALRDQKVFARGELLPVIKDMATVTGMSEESAIGALDRALNLYVVRHREIWNDALHTGAKPKDLAESYAIQLEEDILSGMIERKAA